MKKLVIYLKGILLGFVSLAIPGLSASTIALAVDIYYDMIDAISNIFKTFKKSFIFIVLLILGYATGCSIAAISVNTLYKSFPLVVILLILGFVFGGIPKMIKDALPDVKRWSCILTFVITLLILILYSYVITEGQSIEFTSLKINDYIMLFIVGFISAATLVIPGIDFAVMLLSFGYYYALINLITELFCLTNVASNLLILLIYLLGYGIGTFIFSKLIKTLINKYPSQTHYASLAFVVAAPAVVINKCIVNNSHFYFSIGQLIIGIILFILGFLLIFFLPKIFNNKEKQV